MAGWTEGEARARCGLSQCHTRGVGSICKVERPLNHTHSHTYHTFQITTLCDLNH